MLLPNPLPMLLSVDISRARSALTRFRENSPMVGNSFLRRGEARASAMEHEKGC